MKKAKKASLNGRGGAKLDLTKPVKIAAAKAPRTKSEVYDAVAQHVGIRRRDVAGVFHVVGSIIRADLRRVGPVFWRLAGRMRTTGQRNRARKGRMATNPSTKSEVMSKAK